MEIICKFFKNLWIPEKLFPEYAILPLIIALTDILCISIDILLIVNIYYKVYWKNDMICEIISSGGSTVT